MVQIFPASRRQGVLSGRARPSFPRVALATTRRETRRPMTSTTTTAGSDTDRQAIFDVLAGLYKAWEAGDADAFVADYTDDASVVQPGVYKKDREEIRTTMAAGFAGPLSGSRATDHPADVRFLTTTRPSWSARAGSSSPGRTLSRARDWCARPGCWSGATTPGASPPTTTARPAEAPSPGYGAAPLPGGRPVPGSRRVPGP